MDFRLPPENPLTLIVGSVNEILEVHHIDGDRSNNEPENLRIICPNCHRALTKGLIELKEKVQG